MRIPFDIKYRDKIESDEYKVIYVENSSSEQCPVEILKWDSNSDAGCIIGCVRRKGKDRIYVFDENGEHKVSGEEDRLFIVTPEPEMSEFEDRLACAFCEVKTWKDDGNDKPVKEYAKVVASDLLTLARNEFNKQIENDYREIVHNAYEKGKTDALKDLPRWKIWSNGACGNSEGYPIALVHRGCGFHLVSSLGINEEKYIMLSDLKKLPGFEEEDHE